MHTKEPFCSIDTVRIYLNIKNSENFKVNSIVAKKTEWVVDFMEKNARCRTYAANTFLSFTLPYHLYTRACVHIAFYGLSLLPNIYRLLVHIQSVEVEKQTSAMKRIKSFSQLNCCYLNGLSIFILFTLCQINRMVRAMHAYLWRWCFYICIPIECIYRSIS